MSIFFQLLMLLLVWKPSPNNTHIVCIY